MIHIFSITLLILAILTIFSIIKIGIRDSFTWILIPVLAFSIGFGWLTMKDLRGWPINMMPPDESIFYSSITEKPNIYILARPKESTEPRLYRIEFSDENAKKVHNAMQMSKNGQLVVIKQKIDQLNFMPFDHTKENKKGVQ